MWGGLGQRSQKLGQLVDSGEGLGNLASGVEEYLPSVYLQLGK